MMGLDPFVALAVCGAVVTLAGAGLGVRAWRRLGPADQAFLAVCLRMGIGGRGRSLLRRMAADSGVAPVSLLLSPSVFARCAAGHRPADEGSRRLAEVLADRLGL